MALTYKSKDPMSFLLFFECQYAFDQRKDIDLRTGKSKSGFYDLPYMDFLATREFYKLGIIKLDEWSPSTNQYHPNKEKLDKKGYQIDLRAAIWYSFALKNIEIAYGYRIDVNA